MTTAGDGGSDHDGGGGNVWDNPVAIVSHSGNHDDADGGCDGGTCSIAAASNTRTKTIAFC